MKTNEFFNQDSNSSQDNQNFVSTNSFDMNEMLHESKQRTIIPVASNNSVMNEEMGKPVVKETHSIETHEKHNEEIDQFYQDNINKQWSLPEKVMNRSMYKQVLAVKQNLFKESAEYRLKFYKTMLDTRLEYLNEHCNAMLKMIKGHYRLQVSNFLMAKMEELSFNVRDRQFAFLNMMKSKYAFSESLTSYPSMQQHYLESIYREESNYLQFLDGLLDKFQNIVNEELKKYS